MTENDTARVTEELTEPRSPGDHRTAAGATVVSLPGEIGLLTATALSEKLDALTTHARPDLVLDLRSVTFMDCAGR
ncbi:STAS domain-containing protein [Streptomyces aureus]|uniref:STAS domain-containing protein n=1 Tax=Streptomyces aureus TaxID=193461 RepID=UPI0031D30CA3